MCIANESTLTVCCVCHQIAVGAVIVDPTSNDIVAVSHDRQSRHPLQHAVMTCVDQVAHSQGAGAWQMQGKSKH